MTPSLKGKTIFITGASRGIGKTIALRAARDGANIVVVAKTDTPHPKLEGTVHSAVEEIQAAGGQAIAVVTDIRDDAQIAAAVAKAVEAFGGIDILINNASAISLTPTDQTPAKRFDLMQQVNARGTYLCTQACLPYLKQAANPHVLTLCPPIDMRPGWLKGHLAYTMSKYGMSMCVLGHAAEFLNDKIAVNGLWPRTAIATAATKMLLGEAGMRHCRKPEILSDAAYWILTQPSEAVTGHLFIDEDVLAKAGISDLDGYAVVPGERLLEDFFVGDPPNQQKS